MKKGFSKRTLFIMFFPVVFVLVLLAIGVPQRFLTAITVGGEKYTVVEYNFYYYEAYYQFANDNYNQLGDLGLNLDTPLKKQKYDEDTTWRDYFRSAAQEDMQEYAILNAAADEAGFDASEEVETVRAEKAENIRTAVVTGSYSSTDKYLSQVYDGGMTEKVYYNELASRTRAEAYRDVIRQELTPTTEDAEAFSANYSGAEEYTTADIVVTMLLPAADRSTGETEEHQWENAVTKAEAIDKRAQANGGDLAAYISAAEQFSVLGDETHPDGHFSALTKDDVEDTLESWCFDESRQSGDSAVLRDETGVYLVYFNGWGESNLVAQARADLLEERYDAWLAERADSCAVQTSSLGMMISG